jgi:phage RecT family recombinase
MNQLMNVQTLNQAAQPMQAAGMNKADVVKELSFAYQLYQQNTQLQKCSPQSIINAVVNVANIGLTLNPASKESALVSRWNSRNRCNEAQLMPQYIGLQKLIIQEGIVKSINTQIVYKNDKFEVNLGDNKSPVLHSPNGFGDRGRMVGVYCIATMPDGTRQAEMMSVEEINEIREYSDGYQNDQKRKKEGKSVFSPWSNHYGEMARKTVIKRFIKYLPRGGKSEFLNAAMEADNSDSAADQWQLDKIERLLETANLDADIVNKIERGIFKMTKNRAYDCIDYLLDNQVENSPRYNAGHSNMTELGNAVKEAVERDNN